MARSAPSPALKFVLAALALLAAGILIWRSGWTPFGMGYVTGVDVSRHQGKINWRALAESDVRFAYIKATEGGDYVDPLFSQNWRGAGDAGLFRGAYHYFTLCKPGLAQARHFIQTVPRARGMLPPAIDLEHKGPCLKGPTAPDPLAEIDAYAAAIEQHYGIRPIYYTTREFHDAYLTGIEGERFWLRSLFAPPTWRRKDWIFWQHHNRASRPGIVTAVDLNAYRGDLKALAKLALVHD